MDNKTNKYTVIEKNPDSDHETKKSEISPLNEKNQPESWQEFIITRFTRTL